MNRLPKIGDKVTRVRKRGRPGYPNGTVGKVVDQYTGQCGPILVIEFDGYGRVDLFWKKVKAVAKA